MVKYEYKNTGIEWLSNIPKHWKADRLRDNCIINDKSLGNQTPNEIIINYLDISNVDSNGIVDFDEIRELTFEESPSRARRIAQKYDVVISSVRTNLQAVAYIDFDKENLICSTGFFVCRPIHKTKLDTKFLYYFLLTEYSKDYFFSRSVGVSYPAIDDYKFGSINIPFPPLPEQRAIADYLDKACKRIDSIIDIKQKQLERIEGYLITKITDWVTKGLSLSETETTNCLWIPEIKKGWKIKSLKRMLAQKLKYGANESAENENYDEPRYIRITDFGDDGNLKDDTFKSLPLEIAEPYMLQEGDVLFARSGATVGKTFIFRNYNGLACYAGYLIKANCDRSQLLPEYLYYFTKSKAYQEWKNIIFTQATIQNIGADKYQYLLLPQPTIDEQKEIIKAIKSLWGKTENLKNKLNAQITTLQTYRKSLIHECVTGKKQVWEGEII